MAKCFVELCWCSNWYSLKFLKYLLTFMPFVPHTIQVSTASFKKRLSLRWGQRSEESSFHEQGMSISLRISADAHDDVWLDCSKSADHSRWRHTCSLWSWRTLTGDQTRGSTFESSKMVFQGGTVGKKWLISIEVRGRCLTRCNLFWLQEINGWTNWVLQILRLQINFSQHTQTCFSIKVNQSHFQVW